MYSCFKLKDVPRIHSYLSAWECLLDSRGTCLSAVQGLKESKQASCFSYPAELNTERLNFNKKVLEQIKQQSLSAVVLRVFVAATVKHRSINIITFISGLNSASHGRQRESYHVDPALFLPASRTTRTRVVCHYQ